MIPVYLTTLDPQDYRPHLRAVRTRMYELVRARWEAEPGADLYTWVPQALSVPVTAWQRERRVRAESAARARLRSSQAPTDTFYVLADDDCLPVGVERPGQAALGMAPFLEEAQEILESHSEFAMLSLMPTNARIRPWKPTAAQEGLEVQREWGSRDAVYVGPYQAHEDSEVQEQHSVGGIRICRAGCMTDWPGQTRAGYDQEHCEALRRAGWRVGYYRKIKMVHLGEGYSTVW